MSNPTQTQTKATAATVAPTPTKTPAVSPKARRGPATTKSPAELAAQRAEAQAAQVRNLQRSVNRACGQVNGAGGSVGKRLTLYRGLPLAVREAAVVALEERVATLRLLLGTSDSQKAPVSLAAVMAEASTPKAQ